MHHLLHSHVFTHLHLASHLGTLDAPREGRDVELPQRWYWRTYLGDGTIGQELEWGMLAKRVHLTNTDLSWILGNLRSIISLLISKNAIDYICYRYCCIK
jgi:hypothetical protein